MANTNKHTRATPAGISRSRSRYPRRVRKILVAELHKIIDKLEYEDDLANLYLEAALRCMENPSCFAPTESSTIEQTGQ